MSPEDQITGPQPLGTSAAASCLGCFALLVLLSFGFSLCDEVLGLSTVMPYHPNYVYNNASTQPFLLAHVNSIEGWRDADNDHTLLAFPLSQEAVANYLATVDSAVSQEWETRDSAEHSRTFWQAGSGAAWDNDAIVHLRYDEGDEILTYEHLRDY